MVRRVVVLLAALVCAALGIAGLVRADDGLTRTSTVVDGVPLETVTAAGATGRGPGVVVVHGFSGSTPLMRGFADTLARSGYTVVLLDVAGHGRSRVPFGAVPLGDDVATALRELRAQPTVDPDRVGLLGHSMGAGAVLDASRDPGIAATVAISAGAGREVTPQARNVLVLAGGFEFAGIRAAGAQITRALYPDAEPDRTYGDPAAGTARRYAEIAGVEHISVLFAAGTHRAAVDWFDAALRPQRPGDAVIAPADRAGPALLLHLAAVLAFAPLAALLLPRRSTSAPEPEVQEGHLQVRTGQEGHLPEPGVQEGHLAEPGGTGGAVATGAPPRGRVRILAVLAPIAAPIAAAVVATLVMRVVPAGWLPIRVADYAIGWLAVFGVVLLALAGLRRAGRPAVGSTVRVAAATVVLAAFTVLGFAVPAQLGWAWSTPAGTRLWLLLPAFAAAVLLLVGIERVAGGSALGHAWAALLVVLGITGAALVGGAPSFVLFVAPLFAVLLVWQGVTAAVLRRRAAPVWTIAVVGAALLAWPLALTFPVTA